MAQSKSFLEALRKKYKLGEFKPKARKSKQSTGGRKRGTTNRLPRPESVPSFP